MTDLEQRHVILLQEADGRGEGGREASRESTHAVTASRGPWQSGVPDVGVRAPGRRPGVQSGQAADVDDGSDPSRRRPMGLALRPAAATGRADLLKRDDNPRDCRQVSPPSRPPRPSSRLESGMRIRSRICIPFLLF